MENDMVGRAIYFSPEITPIQTMHDAAAIAIGESLGDLELGLFVMNRYKVMLEEAAENNLAPVCARVIVDERNNPFLEIAIFWGDDPELMRLPVPPIIDEDISMAICEMLNIIVAGVGGHTDMLVNQILCRCTDDPWGLIDRAKRSEN